MVSATTPTYQAITVISLLVAAGILIFMGILYVQNKDKWAILDSARKALEGPISRLTIGHPGEMASLSMQNKTGIEQLGMYIQSINNAPVLSVVSPTGRANVPLVK